MNAEIEVARKRRRVWVMGLALAGSLLIAAFIALGAQRDTQREGKRTTEPSSVPGARESVEPAGLSGLVVDQADAQPVARATITVRARSRGAIARVVAAGADGRFEVALPPGTYDVRATAEGRLQPAPTEVVVTRGEHTELVLRLVHAVGGVTGIIADLESGPLVGAQIEAIELGALGRAPLLALSDHRGNFRLALPAGAFVLTARFDGYVEQSRRIAVGRKPRVENFRLAPGAVVRGRVVRAGDRSAIAGACVRAERADDASGFLPETDVPCAQSAADGRFELTGLPPGLVVLTAHATGWGQVAPLQVSVGIGEERDDVVLTLEAATELRGRVMDSRDRARDDVGVIALRTADRGRIAARGATDANGNFMLEGLAAGRYIVRTVPGAGALSMAAEVVDVPASEPVLLRVATGVTVRGHITPPRSGRIQVRQPLETMSLDGLATVMTAESILTASVEEDGAFALHGVPAGTWDLIASTDQGGGSARVAVTEHDLGGIEIAVDQLASLCGIVRESSGRPLGHVTVTASLKSQPISLPATAYRHLRHGLASDSTPVADDGTFCLSDLPAGEYLLVVRDEQQALMWSARHIDPTGSVSGVSLTAGERRDGFVLEVHRPLVTLRGRVLDEAGVAVPDALVSLDRDGLIRGDAALHFPAIEQLDPGPPVVSGPDGSFEIEVLPAPLRLTAVHPATGAQGQTAHPDPTKPAIVRVRRTGNLHGEARGAGTGTCRVTIDGPRAASTIGTGSGCAFAFSHLPAGRYSLDVRADGSVARQVVEVEPGDTASVHLELERLIDVRLRLVDEQGALVVGLPVMVIGSDEGTAGDVFLETLAGVHPRSDHEGRATLQVAAGDATLAVFSADFQRIVLVQRVTLASPRLDLGDLVVAR